jgi:hypothetical protein
LARSPKQPLQSQSSPPAQNSGSETVEAAARINASAKGFTIDQYAA